MGEYIKSGWVLGRGGLVEGVGGEGWVGGLVEGVGGEGWVGGLVERVGEWVGWWRGLGIGCAGATKGHSRSMSV